MLKVIMLCNGLTVIGLQKESDHARLVRVQDPLLFRYEKSKDGTIMNFQAYDTVAKPREVRFRVDAMYRANEDQTRQYEAARATIFGKLEEQDG